MSNERERLAREWATSTLPRGDAKTLAAIEHIMATTPEPTMADVEWSDEKHHLAGATSRGGDEVVMMWNDVDETKQIICHDSAWEPDRLTPNGKKYRLVEVTGDEHPETLRTLGDYKGAPVGTIVAYNGFFPYVKKGRDVWTDTFDDKFSDDFLSGVSRQVLRWGWLSLIHI